MYLYLSVLRRITYMFSNLFLKSFRILLLPFALLYWLVISVRNWLFDKKILRSTSFGLPVICVGNLAVGGTGKSPMVELLVGNLKGRFKLATLSRGYKRKTKGYALANENSTALEIGDEPMQFYFKFPDVPVAVGEERLVAIPQLLHDKPETQAVILDDAFQHRAVRAGLNILLTDYNNLFTRDFYLPTGDLRDLKSSSKRADIIVVTKCKENLSRGQADDLKREINPRDEQKIYFATIKYGTPYHIINKKTINWNEKTEVLLVTGIANPRSLKKSLENYSNTYYMLSFPDHYIFTIDDMRDIKKRFDKIENQNKIILTTEKDAMRLLKFKTMLDEMPVYVIPIRHHFLFDEERIFIEIVVNFIENFRKDDQTA